MGNKTSNLPPVRQTLLQTFAQHGVVPTPPTYGEPAKFTKLILDSLFAEQDSKISNGNESEADKNSQTRVHADELQRIGYQVFTSMTLTRLNNGMDSKVNALIEQLVNAFVLDHKDQSRIEIEKSVPIFVKVVWYIFTREWFGAPDGKKIVDQYKF